MLGANYIERLTNLPELVRNYKRVTFGVRYEWDEAKNRSNFVKHGLRFEDAELVFFGPCITFVDDRFDYGEERLLTLGPLAGRLVVIAHAPRDEGTRIHLHEKREST